ncbi:MAG: DUF4391 domain-containing protein [Acetobacterium woodii]|nr:DUF4391 domain-containing protein [Acetobacterium woodii]
MFDLPETTKVYRFMPKELFYKYLNNSASLKKTFVDEIGSIIWTNTLSPETIAIAAGQDVKEIAIVEIVLKRQAIGPQLMEIVNREMDQYTLFITRYEDWGQYWCCDHQNLKEQLGQFYCQNYYQSNWMIAKELSLQIEGENLDQLYANFFMQITGKPLPEKHWPVKTERSEQVVKVEPTDDQQKLKELEVTIKELEDQINKEVEFGRQLKLTSELEKAKNEKQRLGSSRSGHIELIRLENKENDQNTAETIRPFFPNMTTKMKEWSEN